MNPKDLFSKIEQATKEYANSVVSEAELSFKRLTSDIGGLEKQVSEKQKIIKEKNNEVEVLTKKIESLNSAFSLLTQSEAEAQSAYSELLVAVNTKETEKNTLEKDVSNLGIQKKAATQDLTKVLTDIEKKKNDKTLLDGEVKLLKEEIVELEEKKKGLASKILTQKKTADDDVLNFNTRLEEVKKLIKEKEAEYEKKSVEVYEMNEKHKDLNDGYSKLNVTFKETITAAEKKLAAIKKEAEEIKANSGKEIDTFKNERLAIKGVKENLALEQKKMTIYSNKLKKLASILIMEKEVKNKSEIELILKHLNDGQE